MRKIKILGLEFGAGRVEDSVDATETAELSVQLYSPADRTKLWSELEERVIEKVPTSKITKIINVDGLTFRAIQEHIDFIVRPGFFLIGDKRVVKALTKWYEDIKLIPMLERGVRSIWRTGNGWYELGYTEDGKDITKLRLIPDEYIDYIRARKTRFVKLDENGEPVGFALKKGFLGHSVKWLKDKIIVNGKTEYTAKPNEDCRDRIAHFILFDQEESRLGYTPLASAYKTSIIRLNLENAVGEGAYRSEGLLIRVKGPQEGILATNEQLKAVGTDFSKITFKNIVAIKENIEIERMPGPDLANKLELIYGLADLQCSALGIPLPLLLDPKGRGYRGDIQDKGVRFEFRERALQARLAEQMRDKLFKRVMKARGMNLDKVPLISFRGWMPQTKLSTARNRAVYARRGLLRWDPEIEKRIREEEDLPLTFVQAQLDVWVKQKNKDGTFPALPKVKPSKEIDVKEMEDLVEEFLERRMSEILGRRSNDLSNSTET